MINKKHLWAIVIFNLIYILGFLFYYLSIGNYEFVVYIAVLLILALIVLFTLKYSKLDSFALWGLSIWGLLHMLGGGLRINGGSLYSFHLINIVDKGGQFFILKTDQAIHFYGFAITAIIVYQLLLPALRSGAIQKKKAIFLAWIGSMGLGAFNEVIEFIAFISLANTGVGDVYNTGLDLIFNMLGAFAGVLIASWKYSKVGNSR